MPLTDTALRSVKSCDKTHKLFDCESKAAGWTWRRWRLRPSR